MRTLEFTRSATWPLILGCWMGICFPAAASPPAVNPAGGNAAASSALPTGVGSQFELTYWQSVSASEDRRQLEAYLAQYPDGTFSGLARAKIATLDGRGASPATKDDDRAADAVPALAAAASSQPVSVGDASAAAAAVPALATSAPSGSGSAGDALPATAELPAAAANASAPAAAAATASAPAPAQSAMPSSLAEQLRALGQSQGARPEAAPAPIAQCVQSS